MFTGVDEQHFAFALFLFGQEPQARGDLRVEEELTRQRDHHFHHIGIDHGSADLAFAILARTHAAVGQHNARPARGLEVVQDMLQPGVVGVALRGRAVFPAGVTVQAGVPPVADVEGRVGQAIVGPQVGVLVAGEGVGWLFAQVVVHAPNHQVHGRQAPGGGVGFLAVDGHIAQFAAVVFDELFRLHKHTARSAARVVNLAFAGREHGHQCFNNAGGRVELPAPLAFGAGKHTEEIFVHLTQDVAGLRWVVTKADGGNQVDQLAQLAVWQLGAGKAFVEDAFELGVIQLDHGQRVVNALANVGLGCGGAQGFPARTFWHPEDVFAGVVVAVF